MMRMDKVNLQNIRIQMVVKIGDESHGRESVKKIIKQNKSKHIQTNNM